jgi:hypothetical protein
MATTTTNFGWDIPQSSDLVKNGATAIAELGQDIDTSMADLKGGTTGQILSKATNTDMDFVWIANDQGDITGVTAGTGISGGGTSGTVTVTNSMATAIDAKGDLIAGTGADAFARLAIGANDLLLTAASGETTGLKYTGGWTTWSPSYIDLTVGNGTVVARYQQIGKTVNYFWRLTWGSTTSCTNFIRVSYPVTPSYLNYVTGRLVLEDNGASTYLGVSFMNSLGFILLSENTAGTYNVPGTLNATTPVTWTTNDVWTISGSYEVA